MLLHLIESGRPHPLFSGPTLWSAGAHVALVASVVVSGHVANAVSETTTPIGEVVYFLPLLPGKAERPKAERLEFTGDIPGKGLPPRDGFTTVPIGGGIRERATGTEAAPPPAVTVPSDSGEANSSPVYLAAELDQPVERDPSSAGPIYPEELRVKNVEGQVVAEWIVDSTGRADSASFRIIESTHPLFTRSVRETLPGMAFRPAQLMGKPVRQLVRQQFKFLLEKPAAPARDTTQARKRP
jgi:periplasmic protein TonB